MTYDGDLWDPEDECEGAPDPANDEPCSHRCGYVDQGQGLLDHELWEHRPCTECGAGKDDGQHLEICGLTHKSDCPRLQPGYVYPEASR